MLGKPHAAAATAAAACACTIIVNAQTAVLVFASYDTRYMIRHTLFCHAAVPHGIARRNWKKKKKKRPQQLKYLPSTARPKRSKGQQQAAGVISKVCVAQKANFLSSNDLREEIVSMFTNIQVYHGRLGVVCSMSPSVSSSQSTKGCRWDLGVLGDGTTSCLLVVCEKLLDT